jgi:hypothetical protein
MPKRKCGPSAMRVGRTFKDDADAQMAGVGEGVDMTDPLRHESLNGSLVLALWRDAFQGLVVLPQYNVLKIAEEILRTWWINYRDNFDASGPSQ